MPPSRPGAVCSAGSCGSGCGCFPSTPPPPRQYQSKVTWLSVHLRDPASGKFQREDFQPDPSAGASQECLSPAEPQSSLCILSAPSRTLSLPPAHFQVPLTSHSPIPRYSSPVMVNGCGYHASPSELPCGFSLLTGSRPTPLPKGTDRGAVQPRPESGVFS